MAPPGAVGVSLSVPSVKKVTTSGGQFTITLNQGNYQISSDRLNGYFTVPAGTGTYNIKDVWARLVVFTNTNDYNVAINAITNLTGDVTASGPGSAAAVVGKINGISITGTPTLGQVPTATGASAATWQNPSGGNAITNLTGDVTATGPGSVPATVAKINGIALSGTPSSGQVLTATAANAANWQTPAVGGGSSTNFQSVTSTNFIRAGLTNLTAGAIDYTFNGPGTANLTNTSNSTITLRDLQTTYAQIAEFKVVGNGTATITFSGATINWRTPQITTPGNGASVDYEIDLFGSKIDGYAYADGSHTHAASDITSGQLALARGGTGADLSATGGANQFVKQSSAGGGFTVGTIADADVPDTITASNYVLKAGDTMTGTLTVTGMTNSALTASKPIFTAADKSLTSTGTVPANQGGTGQSSYAVGDFLYADTTSTLAKLADVATGNALISGGVNTAPSFGKITTAHTTGIAASGANSDITSASVLATISDALTLSVNGALSAPGLIGNGTWITGGTATTTKPYWLIEPTGTTSTGWSTSGTGLGINAASGFVGNLFDAQLAGVSKFKVTSVGQGTLAGLDVRFQTGGNGNVSIYNGSSANKAQLTISGPVLASDGIVAFRDGTDINSSSTDLQLGRDTNARLQLGADAASPVNQTMGTADGSGTDKNGADFKLAGGRGTGTGRGGALYGTTSLTTTTGSAAQSESVRYYYSSKFVDLTESSATLFCNIALGTNKVLGVRLNCKVTANDGTDFQAVNSSVSFAAVNKAGTVTVGAVTQVDDATAASAGTLTVTYTAVANGNGVDIKANAVSSLTQTVLREKWAIIALSSDDVGTITPQ